MANALDREWTTYLAHKQDLLKRGRGRFVLIKGDRIVDFYDTQRDAVYAGYEHFGYVPFLAHRVVEDEPIHRIFHLTDVR
ncbi:MAG: hypothetical protein QNK37_01870 [Acidobacteriota bacterium]|nr:hypothetical protein [Acidobacteriota bacterium]